MTNRDSRRALNVRVVGGNGMSMRLVARASLVALCVGAGLAACAAEGPDGLPEFNGNVPSGNGNAPSGSGAATLPAQPPAANGSTGGSVAPASSQPQTGGTAPQQGAGTAPPNTANPAPSTSPEGAPSGAPLTDTEGNNAGGASAPGAGGAASMPTGGDAPVDGTPAPAQPPVAPPANPPAAQPPAANPPAVTPPPPATEPSAGPAAPDIPCPANATFCSGFESAAFLEDVGFQANPPAQPQFDTAVRRSGAQSMVFMPSSGGFNVREVVVPIPGQAFWARLFIQTSDTFGDNNHDSLFVASTAAPNEDNNAEHGPELSEQGNQILLNADDNLFAAAGPGFPQGTGPQLAADTWHCIEAFFDGGSGDVEVFVDGDPVIDAPGYQRLTYRTFRFGYIQFNTQRTVWFDDVVVAPDRVGCNG